MKTVIYIVRLDDAISAPDLGREIGDFVGVEKVVKTIEVPPGVEANIRLGVKE